MKEQSLLRPLDEKINQSPAPRNDPIVVMSHSTAARLIKEFARESKDPNPAVKDLSPVSEENVFKWTGWLQGITGTPYEGSLFFPNMLKGLGGEWLLDISIPERYPYVPPDMKFTTPICHPNVHFKVHATALKVG